MLEVQKYGLRRFRESRGDFWLACQKKLQGLVMEPDFESLERQLR